MQIWIFLSYIICVTNFNFFILTKSCTNEFYSSYRTHLFKLGSNFSDNRDRVEQNNVMWGKPNI